MQKNIENRIIWNIYARNQGKNGEYVAFVEMK